MKLIAEGADFFLARISADEVAKLEGFSGTYQREQNRRGRVRVGLEIDVAKWHAAVQIVTGEAERIRRLYEEHVAEAGRLEKVLEALVPPVLET